MLIFFDFRRKTIILKIMLRFLIASLFITILCPVHAAHSQGVSIFEDRYSAVILSYHRIGQDDYPESNLRLDQFDLHLKELESGQYNIISTTALINALQNKIQLPPRSIAITFDGAYHSSYENAMKKLIARNIPFTVFYAADRIGRGDQYLDWKTLQRLEKHKSVTLGLMPSGNQRLVDAPEHQIRRAINKALIAHRKHFNAEATLFAYPYGEYSNTYQEIIKTTGFKAAFGLHSGTAYAGTDLFALPRFSLTETFGDTERFHLIASALPLPVSDIEPEDPYHTAPLLNIGFSLSPALAENASQLSCFISDQPEPSVEIIGPRIEIRPARAIQKERMRINCTMPVPQTQPAGPQRWRWFGLLLINNPEY